MSFTAKTLQELARGYARQGEAYRCLICGQVFVRGHVYTLAGEGYSAKGAVRAHVAQAHADRFTQLLDRDKKVHGLSGREREVMALMAQGLTDAQIAQRQGVTPATVRHQRFVLREKARQAMQYLALYQMMEDLRDNHAQPPQEALITPPAGARMVDERFQITEAEREQILGSVFSSLDPLRLRVFSAKEKKKVVALLRIVEQFEPGRRYTEREVNEVLAAIYDDYVTIRRYLIEYGLMGRTQDGRAYWRIA